MKQNFLLKHVKDRSIKLLTSFLFMFLCVSINAQEITVKGVITDADDGLPVLGASVIIKGKNIGTVSNLDGAYVIKASIGDVLRISYVGMENKQVTVSGAKHDVKLKSSAIVLNEVVSIGYGTVKKKELTGAVAHIKSEDLNNIVSSDLGAALQGQISGVNVIASSGAPGSASEILIRGISSVSGSNTPLFVVDGVPQESDPRLSTNEIETIDILKDAASCAIYGTRGAAGVILITTKQGKPGKLKVSYDGSYGVQHITSDIPLMNAVQQTYFDIIYNRNLIPGITDDKIALNLSKYTIGFQYDTKLSDVVFVDYAPTQKHSVNLSGGTKDFSYNVTAGYFKTDGIIINSGFERFNTRVNTNYKSAKWNIGASIGLTSEGTDKTSNSMITQTIKYYPYQASIDLNNTNPIITVGGDEGTRLGNVLENLKTENFNSRIQTNANFNVKYQITKELNVSTRLGMNLTNDYGKIFNPYQEIYNIFDQLVGSPENSYITMNSSRRTSMSWDAGLNYVKTIKKNKFSAFLGYSTEVYNFDSFTATRYGVGDNTIKVLNGGTLTQAASSGKNYQYKLLGMIGRVQYDYKSKYLLSATLRRDGSSKFNPENYYGYFPSASGAWNVSDEKFWKSLKNIANTVKLRASYGTTGNQNFASYSNSASIASGYDYAFGYSGAEFVNLGSIQKDFANSLVKWETSIQSNVGVDLAMLNNKLTFSAEYYNTKKKDMLFPIGLPGSAGGGTGSSVILNVGNMTNEGLELTMGYRTRTGKINWNFNGTFSTNANVITKINGLGGFVYTDDFGLISGAKTTSQVTTLAEGYEAGAFFLYKTNGIVNTTEKLNEYLLIRPSAKMGDLIYVDSNDDKIISDADRVYSGSGLPKYEIGFTLKTDYKGVDLSVQLYSALGHEIMNGSRATAYSYGRHMDLLYSWSEVNPNSTIPAYRGDTKTHDNYRGYTDLWLEDGSYLRVKNITLGYSIDDKLIKKIGLSKIRLYLTAQNPITITNYTGYDPEVGGGISSRGLDKGNYPITSLYTVGLNVNF